MNSAPRMSREIDGKGRTVRELLSGRKYSIDYYQREYKWQQKQVAELLDDFAAKFLESHEEGNERSSVVDYSHYFLGSIIVSDKDGQKFIIDGQQRLCLPLVLIFAYRRLGMAITLAVLVGASLAAHARFHRPPQDPRIVAVNTHFGGPATRDVFGSTLQGQEQAMQRIALTHPNTLILFPESTIPSWTPTHDLRWATTFAQLEARHTGLLIGTTIPIANTQANRNVLLSRGYTERLSYVQRVPVPLGMWHFGDEHNGFP
jgi:hypothetical protein